MTVEQDEFQNVDDVLETVVAKLFFTETRKKEMHLYCKRLSDISDTKKDLTPKLNKFFEETKIDGKKFPPSWIVITRARQEQDFLFVYSLATHINTDGKRETVVIWPSPSKRTSAKDSITLDYRMKRLVSNSLFSFITSASLAYESKSFAFGNDTSSEGLAKLLVNLRKEDWKEIVQDWIDKLTEYAFDDYVSIDYDTASMDEIDDYTSESEDLTELPMDLQVLLNAGTIEEVATILNQAKGLISLFFNHNTGQYVVKSDIKKSADSGKRNLMKLIITNIESNVMPNFLEQHVPTPKFYPIIGFYGHVVLTEVLQDFIEFGKEFRAGHARNNWLLLEYTRKLSSQREGSEIFVVCTHRTDLLEQLSSDIQWIPELLDILDDDTHMTLALGAPKD